MSEQQSGWLRAIDEALVTHHLGVADQADSYEDAKRKLGELIDWHVAVATDYRVNGGWKLLPVEPTREMLDALYGDKFVGTEAADEEGYWASMLDAAPKP